MNNDALDDVHKLLCRLSSLEWQVLADLLDVGSDVDGLVPLPLFLRPVLDSGLFSGAMSHFGRHCGDC